MAASNPRISSESRRGNGWNGTNSFQNSSRSYRSSEPSSSEPSITKPSLNEKKKADSLASLYKHITGDDMNENELEMSLAKLMHVDRLPQELPNETKTFEKLKLYLIKQGKEAEAKQFSMLYAQLKKSEVLGNRDGILNLFHQLFDRKAALARIEEQKKRKTELPRSNTTENFDASAKAIGSAPTVGEKGHGNHPSTIPKLMATMSNRSLALGNNVDFEFDRSDRIRETILSNNRSLGGNITFRAASSKAAIEKELIKDMLFIFQGINTSNIKLVETRDKKEKYQIITKKPLHPSMKLQVFNQCEIGYLYRKIRAFCDKPSTGQVRQGLKHGLERELQEYYKLLVLIQDQMENNDVETPMSDQLTKTGEEMTLQKLSVFVIDVKFRLEALVSMIEAVEDRKGGEICSVLFRYSQYGDPLVANLTTSLLSIVAKPLYNMICQWILYGELEDHFQEFFIYADKECKKENLWHAKFHIRENMLPSFISRKMAEQILSTGKSINFLQDICLHSKGYDGRNEIRQILEDSPVECLFLEDDRILNNAIERAYKTTSEMVLNILVEESRLIDHLKAIKNYLLLGQGDFIQYLLHLLQDELSKPASKLFSHNLQSILESAIRATNAQFEDEDILARVDTRILQGSDKDTGWDVFCLDYKAAGPIGTVLTDEVITRYNRLFNALWRTKRIEGILSTLWKNQSTLFKYQGTMPEIGPVLHRSQLLISEMIHFVHQTQYYIMFEATECTWDQLLEEVCRATDLDQVIKAHGIFLENITKRSLLDDGKRELLNQLRGIFQTVHRFQDFLTKFDSKVSAELERRNQKKTAKSLEATRGEQKDFFKEFVSLAKGEIEALYDTTQDLISSFLLVLNRQQDSDSMTLQCLSFRLDFNEYYGRKDSRLNVPLTYHHRRQSSSTSFYSPMNQSFTGLASPFSTSLHVPVASSMLPMSASLPIHETFEEY